MSFLRYTVTVQCDFDVTNTTGIETFLIALADAGTIVETKAKAIKAPKVEHE